MNIQGNRLLLRAIEETDNIVLKELINDSEIENNTAGMSFPVSSNDQERWFNNLNNSNNIIRCMVEISQTGEVIGTIVLSDINYVNGTAELHYKLLKEFQGRGYGKEIVDVLVNYAFLYLRLNCVYASVLESNIASQKILEYNGFTKEGLLRERIFKNGLYINLILYSKLNR